MPPADQAVAAGADLPAVHAAAHAYEAALVAGDVAAATSWFDTDPAVSRFGPDGTQLGPTAVAAARAAQGPQAAPVWRLDETRELAPGVAVHLAVLEREDVTIQRTQVWRCTPDGWRIAHAHVSRGADTIAGRR